VQLIRQFLRRIKEIEEGHCRPSRDAAIKALLDEIILTPWATPEERSQAQGLVARLERLQWRDQDAEPE
jgi:hypothetical protein